MKAITGLILYAVLCKATFLTERQARQDPCVQANGNQGVRQVGLRQRPASPANGTVQREITSVLNFCPGILEKCGPDTSKLITSNLNSFLERCQIHVKNVDVKEIKNQQCGTSLDEFDKIQTFMNELHQGGPSTLNILFLTPQASRGEGSQILGFCQQPKPGIKPLAREGKDSCALNSNVLLNENGSCSKSIRIAVVHEVGHWLGLFHVCPQQNPSRASRSLMEPQEIPAGINPPFSDAQCEAMRRVVDFRMANDRASGVEGRGNAVNGLAEV
ncbi:hypothetical protein O9K51_07970 [Purpureocillium lavendulum]|uniref:Uncharacterized protein n=1 Tax=Purpureocillium lavendulum TaxID=1247861 RepID=A0AB34FL09_9HYPO|nr:hypothetical protein O9K51_07970 [Purpureocillium lavendulum]